MMRFLKWSVIGVFLLAANLWAADVYVNISDAGDDYVDIYVESTADIGGFQFNLTDTPDAFDVSGASGGLAQSAGFMMSTNANGLVLGFSLTGASIPAGSGVLTTVAINNLTADYSQLTLTGLIFSDPVGTALSAEFNQENGAFDWGNIPQVDVANFTVSPGTAEAGTTGTVEVSLENTMEVGGFQFTLTDTPDLISLVSAATTARTDGFMLSTNADGLVLGFSMTGATIAAGDGPIAVLTFQAGNDGGTAELAFTDVILSDPLGVSINATSENGTFEVTGGVLPEPVVTIISPADGSTVIGSDINVEVTADNLVDGDHYHAYLDGEMAGMYYADTFTLSGIAFGDHELTVVVANVNHVEYTNTGASDTVMFTNQDVPPVEVTTLYLGSDEVAAGGEVAVPLSMTNPDITIAGFQLQLVDFPNYLEVTAVDVTDRTEAFMVTFNEQDDGSVIIVGFDLTAVGVVPGAGPILTITYHSTGIYSSDIETSVNTSSSILSDPDGLPVEYDAENGNIHVNGETPPPIFAPENLSAVPGYQMVNLSWTHPEPWDVVGYYILRDGVNVGEAFLTNYADTGLDTEVEYCYTVIAYNDFVQSEPSSEVCVTTLAQYFEEPVNLTAEENGLEITLTWGPPPSVNACGDDAITALPFSGTGSTVGMTDDWLVQGSQGADFAYMFNVSQDIVIDVTLCDVATDYDTKLEIFTADADCNESTTGYYDDDFTCQYSGLYSSLLGVSLSPGQYYIVVDGFGGQTGNFGISVTESGLTAGSPPSIEDSYLYENEKAGSTFNADTWVQADFANPNNTREFQGYEVYRNNQLLDFTEANNYTDTDGLWYLETYCYNVTAVYDEGTSGFSNTACAIPQLGAPSGLSVHGTGDYITLEWNAHPDNAQNGFNIYRDGELLDSSTDPYYEDHTTEHDVEYCYTVTAFYDGIGESPSTNEACTMWSLYPPSHITAMEGDGYVDLEWQEPLGGEEVALNYDDGALANAFYFYDIYENGYAHGTKFNVGIDFDVLSASVYILSDGDPYWPWPNSTHGPVRVMIFDDDNGQPGNMLYDEEATADETGFATIYPNITGLSDVFYVIVSHTEDWSTAGDPEGFGIDGSVDYPDNMITLNGGVWASGDVLGYGGDYMISSLITAYGEVVPLSSNDGGSPNYPAVDMTQVNSAHDGSMHLVDQTIAVPPSSFVNTNSRVLESFDIYRDGTLIANVPADTYSYRDEPLENMVEYCYTLVGVYSEGDSDPSDPECATPVPGYAPLDLTASDAGGGTLHLDWNEPDPFLNPVLDYQIYRDGENIGMSNTTSYDDTGLPAGVVYCYTVTARYVSGESFPSNEDCSVYVLNPPVGVDAQGLNDDHAIQVTWYSPDDAYSLDIEIFTDNYPGETSWTLTDASGNIIGSIASGSLTDAATLYTWNLVITPGTYTFTINDVWGDGICCGYGEGYYNLLLNSNLIATGGEFGTSESVTFNTEDFLVSVSQTHYEEMVPFEKGTATEADMAGLTISEPELITTRTFTTVNRQVLGYNVYRDGGATPVGSTDAGVYEYVDYETTNDVVYCYVVRAVYEDGESIPSNEACAQWILPPASSLVAVGTEGTVELSWTAAESNDVLQYDVYRDGSFFGSTTDTVFTDDTAVHDVLYCYTVTAVYELGDSAPTNEACAMWMILPPSGLTATAGAEMVHLEWQEGVNAPCADSVIPALPFNDTGSIVGLSDDWPVQGSQGADFAYGLVINAPTFITVDLCSELTDYDSKLEIFTADDECVPTTTGYYDDDGPSCPESPAIFSPSLIENAYLEAGSYYIVVDGFGGDEGNYEINVTQSEGVECAVPPPYDDECYYYVIGIDPYCCDVDWDAICEDEYQGCIGGDPNMSDIMADYNRTLLANIQYESEKSGIQYTIDNWNMAELGFSSGPINVERPMIEYRIYRDGNFIDTVDSGVMQYDDLGLDNLTEYCYTVTAYFDEGESPESNEACATPIPGNPPTNLTAHGENDYIQLDWVEPLDTAGDVEYYIIYKDGNQLTTTNDLTYQDSETVHDVEYCYTVTAMYPTGESFGTNEACTMWQLCPPSYVTADAGDGYVDVSWQETSCGTEVTLEYDDNVLANAFYFYDTYEMGYAHGTRFDVGTNFDLLAASLKILSDGDAYWPWPDDSHGPVRVLIFDDDNGTPGNLLYEESAVAEDGWATIYPNLTGLSGSFYVIATHEDGWADPEGFGIDASVDYPDNMVTMQSGTWSSGDPLGYGGDYMISALINAYGQIQPLSYSDLPVNPFENLDMVASVDNVNGQLGEESHPPFYHQTDRELISYDLFRDDDPTPIATFDPSVYSYHDTDVVNMQEYCYYMTANYSEGASQPTDPVCATPIPGLAPTNLEAVPMTDHIDLSWDAGSADVMYYIVYRDGENIATTTETSYSDLEAPNDVQLCYQVTAMYPSGESFPTNEACTEWDLGSVVAWIETEGNGFIEVAWSDPGMSGGGGDTIEDAYFVSSIPFDDSGTTVGFNDDYDEVCPYSGSTSPDVVYMWVADPGQYHVSICDSNYDTKLYIYDENQNVLECVDDSCNDPSGNPYRSDLNVNITTTGFYYVVVDGYGGASGDYNLSISEGFLLTEGDDQPEKDDTIPYVEIGDADTDPVVPQPNVNRELLGFVIDRDGEQVEFLEDASARSWVDMPVENGIEHCYTVTPVYDEGPAQPSNSVCGAGDAGPMCPPENFDVEIVDGLPFAHLTWDVPGDCVGGGGGGNGNVLVTIVTDSWPAETSWDIVDSSGNMMDGISPGELSSFTTYTWEVDLPAGTYTFNIYDSFGDGIYCSDNGYYQLDVDGQTVAGGPGIGCDFGTGASHTFTTGGVLLSSSEFNYSEPVSGEKGLTEYDLTGIEIIETVTYENPLPRTDRLNGYIIYRDEEIIDSVGPEVLEYTDSEDTGLTFGVEHCWKMKATYDDGESNPTDTICGTVVDPEMISHLYIESGSLTAGSCGEFNVSLTNLIGAAGFQFTLSDTPDMLTLTDVATTDRTDGWMVSFNEQTDGSVILVGFDLQGGTIDPGEGPILTLTYCAAPNILNQTEVAVDFSDVYMGDTNGDIIVTFGHSSTIIVNPQGASELFVGDATCNVDGECDFDISLTNLETEIAGFQFVLSFDPDIAHPVAVAPTDRTEGWSISVGQETGVVIGFSLTGDVIDLGEGPIMTITAYGEAEGVASSCLSQVILSDPAGNQVPASSDCGTFTVSNVEPVAPPVLTDATASEGQIDIAWTFAAPSRNRETVDLSFESFQDGQLAIYMVSSEDVAGFQFNLNSDITGYSLTGASGGLAGDNGFMMSTSSSGLILGFSLTGAVIPAGEGVLVVADVDITGDTGCFSIDSAIFSDAGGNALDVNPGEPFCLGTTDVYGCTDPEALNYNPDATIDDGSCIYDILGCTDPNALNYDPEATLDDGSCIYPYETTFNIYRDGSFLNSVVEMYSYSDTGLGSGETHCYTVTAVLEDGSETGHSNELCATTPEAGCTLEHFADLPDNTGEHSLIIVQNVTGIEAGECDEIGIFDANAILNSGNCDNVLGELLVGGGTWAGEQLSISAVGSIDYCDIGGSQFPGYVEGNPILFRYYSAAEDAEYMAEATFTAGNGLFGQIITSVELDVITSVTQQITLNPYMNNLLSTYVIPDDPAVVSIFGDQVLIVQNDTGDFYVPQYVINQIVDLDYLEGYSAFINGGDDVTFDITGMQADPTTPFTINPFMNDMIPYLKDTEMDAMAAFGPYEEDILIVVNDSGEFYVPAYEIYQITTLVPGEGYIVFLNGSTPIEFSYPADGLTSPVANEWEALKPGLVSEHYDIVKTGVVQPIVITSIQGDVSVGDEIVLYDNGTVVGATRVVDTGRPLPVTAWGAYNQFGVELPGYQVGDPIEIRLWSQSKNTEMRVTANLDGQYYGMSPLTTGSIIVHSDSAVPTQFSLDQNYPNPFNPNTTIEFSMPHDAKISISIYDIMGREIRTLVNDAQTTAGYHSIVWDGMDENGSLVSAGLYIYTLQGEGVSITRKMIMMK